MPSATDETAVDAWLRWFHTSRYRRCRAYLCATYDLDPADAEALINTAALQVAVHWATLRTPLAYFWTTLRRAVQQHRSALAKEQRRREAYAHQQRCDARLVASTTHHVAGLLDAVPPRQRQFLAWFVQGYADAEVAAHLGTTPHAVRQARYTTYIALRHQEAG